MINPEKINKNLGEDPNVKLIKIALSAPAKAFKLPTPPITLPCSSTVTAFEHKVKIIIDRKNPDIQIRIKLIT